MKRTKFTLLAIAILLAVPAFFTSCQEDAPEINYTMSVTVNNDFSQVVEAINSGSLKTEDAIKVLTEAIDKMNTDQGAMKQAIIDVLGSLKVSLETKLAAIEAAMLSQTLSFESKFDLLQAAIDNQTIKQDELSEKLTTAIDNMSGSLGDKLEAIRVAIASLVSSNVMLGEKLEAIEGAIGAHTLSLEEKLDLLKTAVENLPDYGDKLVAIKTAIENLPDYGDKLEVIKTAIEALPDYGEKFDAVVAALEAMGAQIEALGAGQAGIADQISAAASAIDELVEAVNSGTLSAVATLGQIVQKLDELKEALTNTGGEADYVDLGLSVKWARCNLGASKPSEAGGHYAWGETSPKNSCSWSNYKFSDDGGITVSKYTASDGKTVLEAEDDAATVWLGSHWRMPTEAEFRELVDNCTWTWTSQDGMNGYEVKGPNGKSIFLPAAGTIGENGLEDVGFWGDYWFSTRCPDDAYFGIGDRFAYYLEFRSDKQVVSAAGRPHGQSIRPVYTGTDEAPATANYAVVDGVRKPVTEAHIEYVYLIQNLYHISLYLGGNEEGVFILTDNEHYGGKTIDLSRKDEVHSGVYWIVSCWGDGLRNFVASGNPDTATPTFRSGTMQVTRYADDSDGNPVFEVIIENGKGVFGDDSGIVHTLSAYFKGSLVIDGKY